MEFNSSLIIVLSHGAMALQINIGNSNVCRTVYQGPVLLSFYEDIPVIPQMTGAPSQRASNVEKQFHAMISEWI